MKKILKKFRVKSRKSDLYFNVIVYKQVNHLRIDADKYCKRAGLDADNEKVGAAGIVHPYVRERVSADGHSERRKDIGIVRLSLDWLTTEIVAHELIHAAMWLYRLEDGTEDIYEGSVENADFGNSNSEDEETFAYIYGQMFRNINKKLYQYGLWK